MLGLRQLIELHCGPAKHSGATDLLKDLSSDVQDSRIDMEPDVSGNNQPIAVHGGGFLVCWQRLRTRSREWILEGEEDTALTNHISNIEDGTESRLASDP